MGNIGNARRNKEKLCETCENLRENGEKKVGNCRLRGFLRPWNYNIRTGITCKKIPL